VLSLWDRNKIVCAWHVREDFKPVTGDDFQRCLDLLMKHGDRDTYVLARKLKKCL